MLLLAGLGKIKIEVSPISSVIGSFSLEFSSEVPVSDFDRVIGFLDVRLPDSSYQNFRAWPDIVIQEYRHMSKTIIRFISQSGLFISKVLYYRINADQLHVSCRR
jgi:hypothetical protein